MVTAPTTMRWDEPEGATARGTLIVLAGRGETPSVYARFGRRLSADAYRVRVIGDLTRAEIEPDLLVRSLIAESSAHPVVLVGSDTGSLLALRIAAVTEARVAGVITAGLPSGGAVVSAGVDPVAVRSACPVHRRVLDDPEVLDLSAYEREIPADLTLPASDQLAGLPVLGIHGEDDAVAPLDAAREYYAGLSHAALEIVARGRHDILNDVTHRSVAATVVLFVEQLRNDGVPTVRTEEFGAVPV